MLLNIFATILRYADFHNPGFTANPSSIGGIVLIDEIESHMHTDLQANVLPKLLRNFPKVQFIVSSHSPLFLLGMEKAYGPDGLQIIEMPEGRHIDTERFSEFDKSFKVYRNTRAFEAALEDKLRSSAKPIVLCEGETDPVYIRTALHLLGHQNVLDALDLDWIGSQGPQGAVNTGIKALNNARNMIVSNKALIARRAMLLYDCDANKPSEDDGPLSVRGIPRNPLNTKVTSGIENLLPETLFTIEWYSERIDKKPDGGECTIKELKKTAFCDWICNSRREAADFLAFEPVIDILRSFAVPSNSAPP